MKNNDYSFKLINPVTSVQKVYPAEDIEKMFGVKLVTTEKGLAVYRADQKEVK